MKRKVPASRRAQDSRAFMLEEKFDTWLDLEGHETFRLACAGQESWLSEWAKEHNKIVSPDEICELHHLGVTPQEMSQHQVSPCVVAWFLSDVLINGYQSCHMDDASFRSMMQISQKAVCLSLGHQVAHVLSNTSDSLGGMWDDSASIWGDKIKAQPPEIGHFYKANEDLLMCMEKVRGMSEFINVKSRSRRAELRVKKTNPIVQLCGGLGKMTCTHGLVLFEWKANKFLLSQEQFLELLNKCSEVLSYLIYAWCQTGTAHPENHYDNAKVFLHHILKSITKFFEPHSVTRSLSRDNKGFNYLKAMEGLGVAYIIHKVDQDLGWVNVRLMTNLWAAVYQSGLSEVENFRDSEIYSIFERMEIPQIAELIGCVKLAGHPSIEVFKGLDKLSDRVHEHLEIDPQAVERSLGVLIRDLCVNYYHSQKKYPALTVQDGLRGSAQLKTVIDGNQNPSSPAALLALAQVPLETWAQVVLKQNEMFDEVDRQLDLLKDKALGLRRTKIWPILVGRISEEDGKADMRLENRRALITYLLSEDFSAGFKSYLKNYEDQRPWTSAVLDYLVIKLTPKELEEKVEGRMFGASPQEERNRRIVQEKNTMDLMDRYSPDQLLTPDELTTVRKMLSFRYFHLAYPDHVLFQVSFDFSKWNNSFRDDSVRPAGERLLDRWFGRRIWGRTMEAYEHALVYYKDRMRTRHWEGQLGGIEGLNQATWSYIFIGGVKSALENIGAVYQISVKGDDVRAAIAVPRVRVEQLGYDGVRNEILHQLQVLCHDMGWQLNPNETFVSLSVIATSKQYLLKDTWLPASAKKICKMMSHANLLLPTLEDLISSIFSTAHSACSQTTIVMPAFVSASLLASRELYREWINSPGVHALSSHELAALLLWPQVLGGPGALPLQTFFVRGENDMLSVSLSLLRQIATNDASTLREYALRILQVPCCSGDNRSGRLLVSDPYSIPIDAPPRPKTILRRIMRDAMKKWVKNVEVRQLLTEKADQDALTLLSCLLSMRPYAAKIATVIWECSPFFLIDEIISKFEQSSTVFMFLSTSPRATRAKKIALQKLQGVLTAAIARFKFWKTVLATPSSTSQAILGVPRIRFLDKEVCSTVITHEVREALWGHEIVGITYPSLVDQTSFLSEDDGPVLHNCPTLLQASTQVLIQIDYAEDQAHSSTHHYSAVKGLIPWAGSHTAHQLRLPGSYTHISSPTISKVMKLVSLRRNGDYLGPNFRRLVDAVLSGLTSINTEALATLAPEGESGHIPHRTAMNSYSLTTMPNYRPNIAQVVQVNTEGLDVLKGQTYDRTINFAARHYYIVAMSIFPLQSRTRLSPNYPRLIWAVMHGFVDHTGNYHLCQGCAAIIPDNRIEIAYVDRVNLRRYQHVLLVGTTRYEATILLNNIQESVRGRARRLAEAQDLDPTNYLVLEAATRVIVHSYTQSTRSLLSQFQAAAFRRIPQGNVSELFAVAFGHFSLPHISINLLRVVSPLNMYVAVLTECLHQLLYLFGSGDIDLRHTVDQIQRHRNTLVSLFDKLKESGTLRSLCTGSSISMNENEFPHAPFELHGGDVIDGHRVCRRFLAHHIDLFESWLRGEISIPKMSFYINMESDDTIRDDYNTSYSLLARTTLIVGGTYVSDRGRTSPGVLLKRMLKASMTRAHGQGVGNWNPEHGIFPRACSAECLISHFRQFMLQALTGDNEQHSEVALCVYTAMFGSTCLDPLPLPPLDQEVFTATSNDFMICQVKAFEVPTNVRENAMLDLGWSVLSKFVHGDHLWVAWQTFGGIIRDDPQMYVIISGQIYDKMEHSLDITRHLNSAKYIVLTREGAERAIRMSRENILDELLANQIQRRFPRINQEYNYDYRTLCQMPDGHRHHVPGSLILANIQVNAHHEMLVNHPLEFALPWRDDEIIDNWEFLDTTDYLRCAGSQNTSVCKYVEIFQLTHCIDGCIHHEQEGVFMCLADGIGGLSLHLLTACPNVRLIFNTLLVSNPAGGSVADATPENIPVEFLSSTIGDEILDRLIYKGFYPGDLTSSGVCAALIATAKKEGSVSLITCDADIVWDRGLNTYIKLLVNVLHISLEVLSNSGVLIVKTFCIAHPRLAQVWRAYSQFFSHYHVFRSSYTRQHSAEVFLVCSLKIVPLGYMHDLGLLMKEGTAYMPNLELDGYIQQQANIITAAVLRFRETGVRTHDISIGVAYHMYWAQRVMPLRYSHLVCTILLGRKIDRGCFCTFIRRLVRALDASLQSLDMWIQGLAEPVRTQLQTRVGQRYRGKSIIADRGHVLATGWTLDEAWLRNYVSRYCHAIHLQHMLQNQDAGVFPSLLDIVIQIQDLLLHHIPDKPVDLILEVRDRGNIFAVRENRDINVSTLIRKGVLHSMRVWGSYLYTMWIMSSHCDQADRLRDHHGVQDIWADCCSVLAAHFNTNNWFRQIPHVCPHVQVSHVRALEVFIQERTYDADLIRLSQTINPGGAPQVIDMDQPIDLGCNEVDWAEGL